jgi:hypothetical protein
MFFENYCAAIAKNFRIALGYIFSKKVKKNGKEALLKKLKK